MIVKSYTVTVTPKGEIPGFINSEVIRITAEDASRAITAARNAYCSTTTKSMAMRFNPTGATLIYQAKRANR